MRGKRRPANLVELRRYLREGIDDARHTIDRWPDDTFPARCERVLLRELRFIDGTLQRLGVKLPRGKRRRA